MKAKNHPSHRQSIRRDNALPHEVGPHLFALIKRNLLARQNKQAAQPPNQMTFAF